jgi:CRISPR-associated protein Cmr3
MVLEPADTVMIRDGRAFDAGVQSTAVSTPPQPTTVAGAIGAAFGANPKANPKEVRGPLVVRRASGKDSAANAGGAGKTNKTSTWEPLFPRPRDVVVVTERNKTRWSLLQPPAGSGERGARRRDGVSYDLAEHVPFLPEGNGEQAPGWWGRATLSAYLANRAAFAARIAAKADGFAEREPWAWERRVGLARTAERTAADGMLYSAWHLRPEPGTGFAAECIDPPAGSPATTVFFGGDSRIAQVHRSATVPMPEPVTAFDGGRLFLYLATPAVFELGWRPDPDALHGGELVTAVVGGPQVVTTAEPDRKTGGVRSSRLMWAVEAGSVYFLRYPDADRARRAAEQLDGRALAQAERVLTTAGFGLALVGRW